MLREEHGLRWQLYRHGALVACGCIRALGVEDRLAHFDHVVALARLLGADIVLPT